MGVDQFMSTYKKDYLWPNVKTYGLKPPPVKLLDIHTKTACPCRCKKKDTAAPIGAPEYHNAEWSREGPMGALLEPTLYYSAKNGTPSSDVGRYAQPNVFLDKLQQKYPFIYECLKTAPPDDLLSRINKERLTSTYQVDYGKMREYPSGPYDELLRAEGVNRQQCSEPARLPNDPYRPRQKTSFAD